MSNGHYITMSSLLKKQDRLSNFSKAFGEEAAAMRLHKSCILWLVIAIFMSSESTQVSEAILDKFYVQIINGFDNETIGAHCRSKDDDLGNQFLSVGRDFRWHFRSNIFGTTLFYCHLWRTQGHITFLVFWDDNMFIRTKCGDGICRWTARPDGIYSYNVKDNQYVRQYKWKQWIKKETLYACISIQ